MKHFDRLTGYLIADDIKTPLSGNSIEYEKVLANLNKYILSVAGWRTVFAVSGNEEDSSSMVSDEDLVTASIAAMAFYNFIGKENPKGTA